MLTDLTLNTNNEIILHPHPSLPRDPQALHEHQYFDGISRSFTADTLHCWPQKVENVANNGSHIKHGAKENTKAQSMSPQRSIAGCRRPDRFISDCLLVPIALQNSTLRFRGGCVRLKSSLPCRRCGSCPFGRTCFSLGGFLFMVGGGVHRTRVRIHHLILFACFSRARE